MENLKPGPKMKTANLAPNLTVHIIYFINTKI